MVSARSFVPVHGSLQAAEGTVGRRVGNRRCASGSLTDLPRIEPVPAAPAPPVWKTLLGLASFYREPTGEGEREIQANDDIGVGLGILDRMVTISGRSRPDSSRMRRPSQTSASQIIDLGAEMPSGIAEHTRGTLRASVPLGPPSAATVDLDGAVHGTASFSTMSAGYRAMLRWFQSHPELRRVGVDATVVGRTNSRPSSPGIVRTSTTVLLEEGQRLVVEDLDGHHQRIADTRSSLIAGL